MMKKITIFAAIAMTMVGCSSDELVNNSTENTEAPIAFSVEKKNITRGTTDQTDQALEATGHYNFGVWAYKYKDGLATQKVMDNYLVGYSDGKGKGYSNANVTTWAETIGTQDDHKSPWFYENLGKKEYTYTGTDGYYKNDDTDAAFMSANDNQYLRYWDLAYTNTNFYAYAPYRKSGVTFDGNKTITVEPDAQTAGYDDASLNEFMYAGATATNAELKDVKLTFKHLGAQVNLRFYESVRGYRVEIIDVTTDKSGIQATPATATEAANGANTTEITKYYTTCGATIEYTSSTTNPTASVTNPIATVNYTDAKTTHDNLKFAIPVKDNNGDNLEVYRSKYNVIPGAVSEGTTQTYAVSPTVYYPVAQPTTSTTGFTFHVSYKLIAEDNGEEITVHDARVYVPAKSGSEFIAAWQPNTKYTYTFKITESSTGSTDPTTPDVDDPQVPATPQVYPIVFDGATIEDYTPNSNAKEY